jgi:hypothetical protein
MSAPLFDQMLVSIFDVPARRVDQVAGLIWRGHAEGHLDDDQAERLSGAVQLRRNVFAARRTVNSPRAWLQKARTQGERDGGREKRRTWSASGALPPPLRCRFTPGENAVAAVIRAEVRRHGSCTLSYAAIAKSAGLLSTTVVKRFIREARRTGLIDVKHRPVPGGRHKPNVITIISRQWQAWNEVGPREGSGGTAVPSYQNKDHNRAETSGKEGQRPTVSAYGDAAKGLGNRERWRCRAQPGAGGRGNG